MHVTFHLYGECKVNKAKSSQFNGWATHTVNISFTYLQWLHAFLSMYGHFQTLHRSHLFKKSGKKKKSCFWATTTTTKNRHNNSSCSNNWPINCKWKEKSCSYANLCDKIYSYYRIKTLRFALLHIFSFLFFTYIRFICPLMLLNTVPVTVVQIQIKWSVNMFP